MKVIVASIMLVMLMAGPSLAADVVAEDFKVKTTKNLINLCTVAPEDPLAPQAIHFCHGYLVGAFHYYAASRKGSEGAQMFCLPEEVPSRDETIEEFVAWAKDHPDYWGELPVETEFRFFSEIWPCDK